jgi:hypothetical protein
MPRLNARRIPGQRRVPALQTPKIAPAGDFQMKQERPGVHLRLRVSFAERRYNPPKIRLLAGQVRIHRRQYSSV